MDEQDDETTHTSPADLEWQLSSYTSTDNCVRLAALPDGGVAVSDSKDPDGPMLRFTAGEWLAFCKGWDNDEFAHLRARAEQHLRETAAATTN